MSYAAQVIVPPNSEKRAARRRNVNFSAFVRETSARIFPVEVIDVSSDGCRFSSPEPFETATNIWVKISGLTAREARIIWHKAGAYGCEFLKPMQATILDELCTARQRELLAAAKAGPAGFGRAGA
jgi:hypothetical protein